MTDDSNLKEKLKIPAVAAAAAVVAESCGKGGISGRPVRVGFIGLGGRGSHLLDSLVDIKGVAVPALCDTDEATLDRAKQVIESAGKPPPVLYGKGQADYERMCGTEEMDLVICAAGAGLQAKILAAAMNGGADTVADLPMAAGADDCWELVETSEKTGQSCSALGNWGSLSLLNMIRQGVLGDMVHCEGNYLSLQGPDQIGFPIATMTGYLDISRGDRFDILTAMSSSARTFGDGDPYTNLGPAGGDFNCALIRTVGGKMITLNFDAKSVHPSGLLRVQGTRGAYLNTLGRELVFIDGRSPGGDGGDHTWEDAAPYLTEYEHPVVKAEKERTGATGEVCPIALMLNRLVDSVREGNPPDRDVYELASMAALAGLFAQSAAAGSRPMEIPDFTRGKWETRKPVELT